MALLITELPLIVVTSPQTRRVGQLRAGLKILRTGGHTDDSRLRTRPSVAGLPLLFKPFRMQRLATKIREPWALDRGITARDPGSNG